MKAAISMKYRIMIEDKNGLLWCEGNNLSLNDLEEKLSEAKGQYPYAEI